MIILFLQNISDSKSKQEDALNAKGYFMIDLHCHILYGMDDGPRDFNTSLRLCYLAMENGIEKIVATSHLTSLVDIEHYVAARDERIAELRAELERRELNLQIYPGAEVFAGEDLMYPLPLEKVTINGSRYILVEFDFYNLRFSTVLRYIEEILKRGLVPIIAHPERYSFLQIQYDRVNFLMDMGVLFQVNAGSLASRGGREEFDLAYEMVLKQAANFIATDAHSLQNRPNDLLRMMRDFPPNINQNWLERMVRTSPQAVIDNEIVIPSMESGLLKRRRY